MITSDTFFDKLQEHYINKLPFVAYRQPGSKEIKGLLQTDDLVYTVETFEEKGFVFAPFDDSETSILIPLNNSEELQTSYVSGSVFASEIKQFPFNEKEKELHIQLVEKGIKAIENHEFEKVVLSRRETLKIKDSSVFQIFERLLSNYPLAFVYCWYHPKIGLWLGATPETLMKIEGHQFSMMALAGTQDYQGTLDVAWKDKEKKEQQIVTDFIVENLKSHVENIQVFDVETVKAGNLVHLRTMISAKLKTNIFNLKDIVSALHPTPAVCGMPKQVAKDFIMKNEDYKRMFYSGYLGELNYETTISSRSSKRNIENRAYSIQRKCSQLYVNLRCMQIKNNMALIYIGGGITKSSNPEKEWEETVSKSKIIKRVLS